MAAITVLLADDETSVLEIMARQVAMAGYNVISAGDGQEALDKIKSGDPDVILLDLTMPKLDGLDVLKQVREADAGKKWRPVIIISGQGELQNMRKGFDCEADHYLTKPCRIEDIIKAIRQMAALIPMRNP